jgi:hypothetical protein
MPYDGRCRHRCARCCARYRHVRHYALSYVLVAVRSIVVHTAVLAVVATLSSSEPLLRSSQIRNSVVKLPGETMCAMKFDAVAVVGNVNL